MEFERIKAGADFMDPKTTVTFSFTQEAAEHLPQLHPEDIETDRERFAVLMGEIDLHHNRVNLDIQSVLWDSEDDNKWYHERSGEVEINLTQILHDASLYSEHIDSVKGQVFLGMIHTHPSVIPEAEHQSAALPSDGDIEAIAGWIDDGLITKDKPFIFAIAGYSSDGTTHYILYRPIIKNGVLEIVHLDNITDFVQ